MSYLMVDANNLAYRCFFAQMELRTLDGRGTGMIHGFFKSLALARHITMQALDKTCIFWDGGRSKKRISLYPNYKKGRKLDNPTDPIEIERLASLRSQMQTVKAMLRCRPVRQIEVAGVEADDMIALLARATAEPVIILSGDKDMQQLASSRICIFDPKKGLLSQKDIAEYWGLQEFDSERLLLLRAIQGDASDAISGVATIGKVRACAALPYLKVLSDGSIQALDAPDAKTKKWVDLIVYGSSVRAAHEEKNQDIVRRNMTLMRLAHSWENQLYASTDMESALAQFQTLGKSDYGEFVRYLKEYELADLLGSIERY